MLLIGRFLKNFLLILGVGLLFFMAVSLLRWVQPSFSVGLLLADAQNWLLRYLLFFIAVALFRTMALPKGGYRGHPFAVLCVALLLAGGALFVSVTYAVDIGQAKRAAEMARVDAVRSGFKRGVPYFVNGMIFVPGAQETNEYSNSLLAITERKGTTLFVGTTLRISNQNWLLHGGWSVTQAISINKKKRLQVADQRLFKHPQGSLGLEQNVLLKFCATLPVWPLFSVASKNTLMLYLEGGLSILGLFLFVVGFALMSGKPSLDLPERFFRWMLFLLCVVLPIFLLHYGWELLITRASLPVLVAHFSRAAFLLVIGAIFWRLGMGRRASFAVETLPVSELQPEGETEPGSEEDLF